MKVAQNFPLQQYNSFGIQVTAEYFAGFESVNELMELLQEFKNNSILILGGGSNVLFTDNFKGAVLKNNITGIEILEEDAEKVKIRVGAGVVWHELVMYCIQNNYGGLENLSLIPGSVGAAPIQNIGAYGVEQEACFYSLEVVIKGDNNVKILRKADCRFGYRNSIFKQELKGRPVILYVTYVLKKQPIINTSYGAIRYELERYGITNPGIREVSEAVIRIRNQKLPNPSVIGNAGSFFKNPVIPLPHFEALKKSYPLIPHFLVNDGIKLPAAWLIEKCGWKGYRKGDAGCHVHQPLVLVNYGNATGKEIYLLSEEIIISVKEKFAIELEREVNIINKMNL